MRLGISHQDGTNRCAELVRPTPSPPASRGANVSRMSRTRRRTAALALVPALALALVTSSPAAAAAPGGQHGQSTHHALPSWQLKPVATTNQFRGLDAVSQDVAWVGGTEGGIFRTVDGGDTWEDVSPPGTTKLEFRDVEAFGRNRAVVLAAGTLEDSRIYRTDDGGQTWTQTFINTDPDPHLFYDCMAFSDPRHGLALSDPSADGKFRIMATHDGGRSWQVRSNAGMPAALAGEFAFAASGTCITTTGKHDFWFATGGGAQARVFHSRDFGRTWTVADTPVLSAPTGGIFSLAFRDARHGFAIGGDFLATGEAVDALAVTTDGGSTWRLIPAEDAPAFYRSGSAFVQRPVGHHSDRWLRKHHGHGQHNEGSVATRTALAVGPQGSDISFDGGNTWTALDPASGGFDAVECAGDGSCWASGPAGKVARLAFPHHR
jgi:photosystem II stability/assembly factor-like uncharacterized protein